MRIVYCLIFAIVSLYSFSDDLDDSLEDMFPAEIEIIDEEPVFIIEEDEGDEETSPSLIDELMSAQGPKITGGIKMRGGLSAGYKTLDFENSIDALDTEGVAEIVAHVDFDIRVSPNFRFFSKLYTELDESNLEYTGVQVDQLYIDYTWAETLQLRMGTFPLTWGKGFLLKNPGNFVYDVSESIAVKSVFPVLGNSFTTLIYSNNTLLKNDYFQKAAYGFFYEFPIGDLTAGVSGHHGNGSPGKIDVFMKTNAFGWDLALENIASIHLLESSNDFDRIDYTFLANAFYDSKDTGLTIIIETVGDLNFVDDVFDIYGGLGITFNTFRFFGMKPGIRALHNFTDNSGQLVFGMKGGIAERLSLEIAVPVTYGDEGTYYQINNIDPFDRDISLSVLLNFNTTF